MPAARFVRSRCHKGSPGRSASNAYTQSSIVAMYTVLWTPRPGISTPGRYNGCANTEPFTV